MIQKLGYQLGLGLGWIKNIFSTTYLGKLEALYIAIYWTSADRLPYFNPTIVLQIEVTALTLNSRYIEYSIN